MLSDINHSKIFFDPPPRIMKIKTKRNKWGLIKLKSFCTAKETINKIEKATHRIGENTISLTSGAGKTGQPLVKDRNWNTF